MGTETLSDVTLLVDDRLIPAHKVVLANASPVFMQMFNSDLQESATGQVPKDTLRSQCVREPRQSCRANFSVCSQHVPL